MSHTESAAQPGRLVEMTWVTAAGTKGAETVLTETSMILNREWVGKEIYLLVLGYLVMGVGLVAGGVHLWRGSLERW